MSAFIGIYFSLIGVLDPSNSIFFGIRNIYLAMLAALCIVFLLVKRRITVFARNICVVIMWMAIGMLIPTVVFVMHYSNYEISQYVRVLLHVPIVIYVIVSGIDFRKFLLYCSFLFNGVALYQMLFLGQMGRASSLFNHPNFYSVYLTVIVILLFERIMVNRGKRHVFEVAYIGMILLLILFGTGARTSFALILAMFAFAMLVLAKNKARSILILFAVGVLAVLAFVLFREQIMATRVFNMYFDHTFVDQIHSLEWRWLRWSVAFQAYLESGMLARIFGTGWQSSPFISARFYGFSMHNEYLRMLIDFGIIGFLSYIASVFVLFVIGLRRKSEEGFLLLALIMFVIIIAGFTENIFVSSESFSTLIGTLALALGLINKKKYDSTSLCLMEDDVLSGSLG